MNFFLFSSFQQMNVEQKGRKIMKKFLMIVLMGLMLASPAMARPHGGHFGPRPPHHRPRPVHVVRHHDNPLAWLAAGVVGGIVGGIVGNNYEVRYTAPAPAPAPVYVPAYGGGVSCTTTTVNGVTTQNCTSRPTVVNGTVYF